MASKKPKSKQKPNREFKPAGSKYPSQFTPTSNKDVAKKAAGFYDAKISWNIGRMAQDGNFCCSLSTLHNYHNAMARFEGQKYQEIFAKGTGNRHDHAMPVKRLNITMQNALIRQKIDVDTEVHQLHLGQSERLFGVIEDDIFHILLFDPDHKGYTS